MDQSRSKFLWYAAACVLAVVIALRAIGGGGESGAATVSVDAGSAARPQRTHSTAAKLWIHVAGAVRRPGLYRVHADARVGAAVDAAGGLTSRADLTAINLAATLRDGQQVIVPARGRKTVSAPPAAGGPSPAAAPAPNAKISLSTATVEQLDTLDGIGPALAQRIVEWRDAHGGFRSLDQLSEVEGIGDKRLQALKAAVVP